MRARSEARADAAGRLDLVKEKRMEEGLTSLLSARPYEMFSCAWSGSTSPCQRISNPSIQIECLHPNRSAICAILSLSGGETTI